MPGLLWSENDKCLSKILDKLPIVSPTKLCIEVSSLYPLPIAIQYQNNGHADVWISIFSSQGIKIEIENSDKFIVNINVFTLHIQIQCMWNQISPTPCLF